MKFFRFYLFAIVLSGFITNLACDNSLENQNSNYSPSNQNSSKAIENKIIENLSPIKTINDFVVACKNQDVEALRKTLSRNSFRLVEEKAKNGNKTVAEVLNGCKSVTTGELPASFNEKIYTDTATVDVKNRLTNQYDKIPFVKEDGLWKIAIDQFDNELTNKMNGELKKQDNFYENEVEKVESNHRLEIAKLDGRLTYTLEQELEIIKEKQVLDRKKYDDKVALVNRQYAAKKKIIDNSQKIKNGVFFKCLFYF